MSAVRHAVMSRLVEAVAADHPGDYVRQAGTIQHLEHLARELACLPPRQLRAIAAGLAECCPTITEPN